MTDTPDPILDRLHHAIQQALGWRAVDRHPAVPNREHRPCPICGGPMVEADLPVVGGPHTPCNMLHWRRCGSCGRHQEGAPTRGVA